LRGAECVGRVSYSVGAGADVLLGSTAFVCALKVGPVIATAGIAVVPRVLARLIVLGLNRIIDQVVVVDMACCG